VLKLLIRIVEPNITENYIANLSLLKNKQKQQRIGIFHAYSHTFKPTHFKCVGTYLYLSGFHYVIIINQFKQLASACFLWQQTATHQLHNTLISKRTQQYRSD